MTASTNDVRGALAQRAGRGSAAPVPAVQTDKPVTVYDWLGKVQGQIRQALPSMVDHEQFMRACMTTIRLSPDLQKCSPASIIGCAMQTAQLGLAPDTVLGQAYWVPFHNSKTGQKEASFIIGYRGYLELIRRTGQVQSIMAREVYEGDHFELEYGLNEKLVHKPALDVDPDPAGITHLYAVAHMIGGGHAMFVMTKSQVDAIRKRSKASGNGPWVTDYAAMARKTVIRQLVKFLPLSVEAQRDLARDGTIARSLTDDVPVYAESDPDVVDVTAAPVTETAPEATQEPAEAPADGKLV